MKYEELMNEETIKMKHDITNFIISCIPSQKVDQWTKLKCFETMKLRVEECFKKEKITKSEYWHYLDFINKETNKINQIN